MGKIILDVNEREYTLEFSRETALQMEQMGFTATDEFLSKPITALDMLFYGSLLMHQPNVNRNLSKKILSSVEQVYDTSTLAKALVGFYGEAVNPNADPAVEKKQIQILEN